jgi:hypothetical protein
MGRASVSNGRSHLRIRSRAAAAATAVLAAIAGAQLTAPPAQATDAALAVPSAVPLGFGTDVPLLPDDDPFYRAPDPLPKVAPGTILRSRPVTVRGLGIPMPVKAWQVLYRSTDAQGRPNAVSGTLAVLDDGMPVADRPLVAYNIGTHGLAPKCAPSYLVRKGEDPEEGLMAGVVGRGWAIMVTDYEGQGTPGPHTYTSGLATGRAVLDGVRAALRLPAAGLGKDTKVGLWGYSEGGFASAWAAELAGRYAPELNLRGTAAGGVPAKLLNSGRKIDGGPLSGFLLASAVGLDRADPRMKLASLVNKEGAFAVKTISRQCVSEWLPQFANHPISHYTQSKDPLALPHVKRVISANHLGRGTPNAPMFVYEAVNDEFIPVEDVRALVRTYCKKGVTVSYTEDPYGEHITYAAQGAPAALDWLAARFAGEKAPSTC